jgi:DNA polymerase I
MKKKLAIVDVSSFIFRAFYAIRPLHAPDGTPVNAIHGVLNMLLKLLADFRPSHVIIARDTKGGSFRNELYTEYKANRGAPPEELVPQFPLIVELLDCLDLPHCEMVNYEADDVIGSISTQWKKEFDEVFIVSSDKDLMQFVGENVVMVDTMKGKTYDDKGVFEKMGVRPDQIVDYLSIIGDASDNIPGMKGIGAKGAVKLLEEFNDLDTCIANKEQFKGKRLINAFTNHLDDALMSKKLINIVTDLKLPLSAVDSEFNFYPSNKLIEFLERLGFNSMIKKIKDLNYQEHKANQSEEDASEHAFVSSAAEVPESVVQLSTHHLIDSEVLFDEFLLSVAKVREISCVPHFNSDILFEKELEAITFALDSENSHTIHLGALKDCNSSRDFLLETFKGTWGNEEKEICGALIKEVFIYLMRKDIELKSSFFDIIQAHFVINPSDKHDLDYLVSRYLDKNLPKVEKGELPLIEQNPQGQSVFLGERACAIFSLQAEFKSELEKLKLQDIYFDLDNPLLLVLAKMEKEGVFLNKEFFKEMEKEVSQELDIIEKKIEEVSGESINLKSPKQVGELLFTKLNLPVILKTKTGPSTNIEVLEELDSRGLSDIPGMIIKYREYDKLLSTYIKAMPILINPVSGRIHTSFNQHVAATGRLSSTHPNLQNIPIRSEMGQRLRKGFVATPGKLLLSADYSQVELRLLAHFSKDPAMLKAFKEGVDIHTQTAAEVMGVPVVEVTPSDRSNAKAINFGLMYGQSSFGLAKQLRISRGEAKDYITRYFERFFQVKSYLDSLKEECSQFGYTKTLRGRKRFLPDIHSKNRTVKGMAERAAINTPIQGTAADIIKLAMINIQDVIEKKKLDSKMILQVHDELIFEVPENELAQMREIVQIGMESVVDLDVTLKVDMGLGVNWFDLKG